MVNGREFVCVEREGGGGLARGGGAARGWHANPGLASGRGCSRAGKIRREGSRGGGEAIDCGAAGEKTSNKRA